MANSKGIFVTLAAVVVAGALGYFAGKGATPAGTEGTIGAADRYTSTQINPGDVSVTEPDVQAFMESDLFRQMQADAEFQKLVTTGRFEALLKDAEFARRLRGISRDVEGRLDAEGTMKDAEGTSRDAEGTMKDAEGTSRDAEGTMKDAEARKGTAGTAKDAEARKGTAGTAKDAEGTARDAAGTARDAEGTAKDAEARRLK